MKQKTNFNFAERIMLQHAYIPKLTLDCLGIVVSAFLFWYHQLVWAVVVLIGLSLLGNVVAWNQDIKKLAKTPLGKWMLYQAKPVNLIIRTIGAVILAYGLWLHSWLVLLVGLIVILIARLLSK